MILETADEYYDLITYPNRGYYPGQFHYLVDEFWMKESNVVGVTPNLNTANFTFDESFDRVNSMTTSNYYNQLYVYINRWNIVIDLVDYSVGSKEVKELAKAEAKIFRAFDHFMLVNVYAKAYNPATAATDGGICIMAKYDLEAQP
ncbi:MAG: RagB/SusD family nutrient uptake outer membrane protein, partial [Phocaeicola sp.]